MSVCFLAFSWKGPLINSAQPSPQHGEGCAGDAYRLIMAAVSIKTISRLSDVRQYTCEALNAEPVRTKLMELRYRFT